MGCDIHAYLEESVGENWRSLGELDIDRWYDLFGVLAGVRVPLVPIAPLRGAPADLSKSVAKELKTWSSDAHSITWYSVRELLRFDGPIVMTPKPRPFYFEGYKDGYAESNQESIMESYKNFLVTVKKAAGTKDKALLRVVMWFDN